MAKVKQVELTEEQMLEMMAQAENEKAKLNKFKDRKFMILLYPDDVTHARAYEILTTSYDFASILHDKDIYSEMDITSEIKKYGQAKHDVGELKKPHYHIIISTGNNPKWNTALAKELGIEVRFIEKIKKVERALEYLIHYNDEDKYQYDVEEVQGVLKSRLKASINSIDKSEGEKVKELIDYIRSQDGVIMYDDFGEYCAVSGYWDVFRRSQTYFLKVIDQHNEVYRKQVWKDDMIELREREKQLEEIRNNKSSY